MRELLEKLISMKTVTSDLAAQEKALQWIGGQLSYTNLVMHEFLHNGVPSTFWSAKGQRIPRLLLAAHLDVVPACDEQFNPRRVGTRLFGRGAIDMKFAIACYLTFFEELSSSIHSLDIGLMITTDEETGGQNGACKIAELGYGRKTVFLPDGGSAWEMEERAKGMYHFEVISRGRSVHAACPWDGVDPMPVLMKALQDIYALAPSEPCGDVGHTHPSISVGRIFGGDAGNQVAESFHALIDVRCFEEDRERIHTGLVEIAARHECISVKSVVEAAPYENDLAHLDFKLFRTIAQRKGITVGTVSAHGSSDARFFTAKGMPVLLVSPLGDGHHSADEWIDLDDLATYYEIFKEWAIEVSSQSKE